MKPRKPEPLPAFLEHEDFEDFFQHGEFLPRPDWEGIYRKIDSEHSEQLAQASADIGAIWLQVLAESLGAPFKVFRSHRFLLLTSRNPRGANFMLKTLESYLQKVLENLGFEDEGDIYTVLHFPDHRHYEEYVSDFGPDGEQAGSGGMFITHGYPHMVLFGTDSRILDIVSAHELAHYALFPSYLPLWLEEGVATNLEALITGYSAHSITREDAEKQRALWPEYGIKHFWSGESFRSVEGQECSYQLAFNFTRMLAEANRNFPEFLKKAHFQDAGFQAARECLGVNLAEELSGFLGPGDWSYTPVPGP